MSLEDRFDELPEELKEKAKACKSADELAKLASDNMIALSDEEIEGISGGSWANDCSKKNCGDYESDVSQPSDCKHMHCHNYNG